MADTKRVPVNGTEVEIEIKSERPASFVMTEDIGVTAAAKSGERIEVVRAFGNPFVFLLRGEKITGTLDVRPLIQEALLHVTRENAP